MKKILFFLHNATLKGGSSRSFLDLITMIVKDFDVYIVMPRGNQDFTDALLESNIQREKIYVNEKFFPCYDSIKNLHSGRNRVKKLLYRSKMNLNIKQIKKHFNCDFDLIYSNSLATQLGCEYAISCNIPHIWHVREFMEEDHNIDFLRKKYTYNKLFPYSNAVFITNKIEEKFGKFFGENQIVLHNYVRYDFVEKNLTGDFIFTVVGGITESKGQRYAIEAFADVQKSHQDARLWIVGDGNDREYCEQLVQKYEIQDKVKFFGQRNDVNEILAKSNVQLVCSRFEAMGRVTAEAMLSKTPVIGADTAGTKELIGNSYGLLYREGNTEDLKDKMFYSIENYDDCLKTANKAYEFAKEEFSYDRYKNSLCEFININLNIE